MKDNILEGLTRGQEQIYKGYAILQFICVNILIYSVAAECLLNFKNVLL